MARELVLCEGCKRHVFAKEATCPFCHTALSSGGHGLTAAVALSAGLSLAGCTPPAPVYGGPPPPAETPVTAQTSASPPMDVPAPAYGIAPPPLQSSSATAKPTAAVAAYGGPPPRVIKKPPVP
jgi:hypothetical protein